MNRLKVLAPVCLVALLTAGVNYVQAAAPPAPAAAGSSLEQRLAQRKAERGIVLSPQDTQRLTGTCPAGQSAIRLLQISDIKTLDNRTDVYNAIDAKLLIAIGQLKLAGEDSFHLEEQRQAYATKLKNFNNLATDYRQVLDDILLINCKTDPTGFKVLLETARLYNDQLRGQADDMRSYVVDTLKTTLKNHIDNLETDPVDTGGQ